jgi:hypothetical protein
LRKDCRIHGRKVPSFGGREGYKPGIPQVIALYIRLAFCVWGPHCPGGYCHDIRDARDELGGSPKAGPCRGWIAGQQGAGCSPPYEEWKYIKKKLKEAPVAPRGLTRLRRSWRPSGRWTQPPGLCAVQWQVGKRRKPVAPSKISVQNRRSAYVNVLFWKGGCIAGPSLPNGI